MAKIKRFGVLKTAGFIAFLSFFIGIIFTLLMWVGVKMVSNLVLSSFGSSGIPGTSIIGSASFSWIYILILPFVYAIITFILGLVAVSIMNLTLKITKGIDIDLEVSGKTY